MKKQIEKAINDSVIKMTVRSKDEAYINIPQATSALIDLFKESKQDPYFDNDREQRILNLQVRIKELEAKIKEIENG